MNATSVTETSKKGLVIHVSPDGHYFVTKVDNHPDIRTSQGKTKDEALGALVKRYPHLFGIERIQA